jgi:hypothetical protein
MMSEIKSNPRGANLRIACVQLQPQVGHKRTNLEKSLAMIERAAAAGAQLERIQPGAA